MLFVTWLALFRGLSPASISTYTAAVRSLHLDVGLPDLTAGAKRLQRLMRGVRRHIPNTSSPRLPITNNLLQLIAHGLSDTFNHVMFWAACCTAFFGFLRVSEFTCSGAFDSSCHLAISDVRFDPSGFYSIYLKRSKTDPFAAGCTVYFGPTGRSNCPGPLSLPLLAWQCPWPSFHPSRWPPSFSHLSQ